MKKTIEYIDREDAERILAEEHELRLIETQVLLSGNFLVFTDEPEPELKPTEPTIIYTQVPLSEFQAIQKALDDLILGGGE